MNSILYLVLSLIPILTPPLPDVLVPRPRGLFASFENVEYSEFGDPSIIQNLWKTKPHKIIEVDEDFLPQDSSKDTTLFDVFANRDSITIDEHYGQHVDGGKQRHTFLSNGKLASWAYMDGKDISSFGFYDKVGSWLECRHIKPNRVNPSVDTVVLMKKTIYDKSGRPLETDQFLASGPYAIFGKIRAKMLYQYDAAGTEIKRFEYERRGEYPPVAPSAGRSDSTARSAYRKQLQEFDQRQKFGKEVFDLTQSEDTIIDSSSRTIVITTLSYFWHDTTIEKTRVVVKNYDAKWTLLRQQTVTKSERDTLKEDILYLRDPKGLLQTTVTNGDTTGTWKYDKNGRCIVHTHWSYGYKGQVDSWTYDSKGNIVEYVQSYDGKTQFRNRFTIFYK